jgi:acyl-CoA synthetase (NDP forming)
MAADTGESMQRPAQPKTRQDLSSLLAPGSVAIVGISHPDRFGGIVFNNLRTFGYAGKIFGVNPRYETLYGRPCYPSLADLPETPDCVLLAVPNRGLLAALEEAADSGVRAAVIFGSARLDPGGGEESLSARLKAVAQKSGMVICGPNGMGFVAMAHRLPVTGYVANPEARTGGVALITHSGSVWDAFLQNDRDLGFNYIVSSGSEMVTTVADYMQFALADPSTRVIGLFLETVRDPETFKQALAEAAERDIPVVVLKTGRTERSAELARAHSGALAGRDAAYDALFRRYGVSRCTSIDEMMDTLELFSAGIRPRTRKLSALHDSGGQRALVVDLAEEARVEFAAINEETVGRLAAVLEPGLDPINPLDAWGTGNDASRIYEECLRALDADPETGLTLAACDLYPTDDAEFFYPKLVSATLGELQNPLVWLVHLTSATSPLQAKALRAMGVPVLMGTETGIRAVAHLIAYTEFQRRLLGEEPQEERSVPQPANLEAIRKSLTTHPGPLDEYASKEILAAYGLTTTRELRVGSVSEAREAGEKIGYPLVLKTAAGDLHKTERGGVRLGIRDADELASAYRDFESRLGGAALVQEMVPEAPEIFLGMVNDAQFGPLLSLASGGIHVEILNDVRMLSLPTTPGRIRETLLSLRGAALFLGARGRAPADREAVVRAALGLAALAEDLGDQIAELDINPLRMLGDRAVVVDALIVPKGKAVGPESQA